MAATTLSPIQQQQWHPGEQAMHRLLRVPRDDNPTFRGLAPSHGHRISQSPVVALGTLDGRGRPWAALWGGERGFCRPVADGVLGVRAVALDVQFDPVLGEVLGVEGGGEDRKTRGTRRKEIVSDQVVHPDADEGGKLIAALAIDLETRDRVKFAGRALAGAVSVTATATAETEAGGLPSRLGDLQMAIRVEETLGNCPKYLNKKRITPHVPSPRLVPMGVGGEDKGDDDGGSGGSGATQLLSREAIDLVERADLFFIASRYGSNGEGSMDVNHRGGAPGFMRVLTGPNTTATTTTTTTTTTTALVYPEYSGNRLYQTLGNLHSDPRAGLAIPDFATGDVLYVTGRASILLGEDAAAACLSRGAKLAVRVDVEEARLVRDGLPFRGEVIDFSPYNPPAPPVPRRQGVDGSPPTRTETGKAVDGGGGGGGGVATATLVDRQVISPSVARYVFKLSSVAASDGSCPLWRPGQHVTLDFGAELDHGWSHMRDDDPQSLNDDFVRTFTVSSSGGGEGARAPPPNEFEITVRRHGPATGLLAKWNLRVPLELPVLGFGGAEGFRLPIPASPSPSPERESVFVAAGVGITPLMAQAADVLRTAAGDNNNADGSGGGGGGGGGVTAPLRVLWSLKREDLPLAVHVLKRIEGLGKVTRLFVTGGGDGELEGRIRQLGAVVTERRMGPDDVLATGEKGNRRFYCCTGPEMMKALLQWTEGEEVVFESFNY